MDQSVSNTLSPKGNQQPPDEKIALWVSKDQAALIYVALTLTAGSLPTPSKIRRKVKPEDFIKVMLECHGLEYSKAMQQQILDLVNYVSEAADYDRDRSRSQMDPEDFSSNDDLYGDTGQVLQLHEGESLQVEAS